MCFLLSIEGYLAASGKLYYALALLGLVIPQMVFQVISLSLSLSLSTLSIFFPSLCSRDMMNTFDAVPISVERSNQIRRQIPGVYFSPAVDYFFWTYLTMIG